MISTTAGMLIWSTVLNTPSKSEVATRAANHKLWRDFRERTQVYKLPSTGDAAYDKYYANSSHLVVDELLSHLEDDPKYAFGISEVEAVAVVQTQQPQLAGKAGEEFIKKVINDNVTAVSVGVDGYNFVRVVPAGTAETDSLIASHYRVFRVLDAFITLGTDSARIDSLVKTICNNDRLAEAAELINDICKMTELHLLEESGATLSVAPVRGLIYYPDDDEDSDDEK